jgi:NADH-quinone oxidoreductase subunit L
VNALLEYAWLVVLLPLLSAVLITAFGKQLPGKGIELGIASLGIAWVARPSASPGRPSSTRPWRRSRAIDWSPLGGGFVFELGMLVDGLTAMMLLLVTTVSSWCTSTRAST